MEIRGSLALKNCCGNLVILSSIFRSQMVWSKEITEGQEVEREGTEGQPCMGTPVEGPHGYLIGPGCSGRDGYLRAYKY